MEGRVRGRDIIFLIAGGYLCYLGVNIIRTGIIGGQITPKWKWLGLLCAIAFLVFGAGEVILCIRRIFASSTDGQEEEALENLETADGETTLSEEELAAQRAAAEEAEKRGRSIQDLIAENQAEEETSGSTEDGNE